MQPRHEYAAMKRIRHSPPQYYFHVAASPNPRHHNGIEKAHPDWDAPRVCFSCNI